MKKFREYNYYLITILYCLITSCAQITAPTGGDRDKNPPKILQSSPETKTINFNKNEINIRFNEWILSLTNPKTQIIISPNIDPFPKITTIKNNLSIKFKENSLQPNTTYSIFFGNNLKDNNEGNVFPNFKYIFSTGNFIDSLIVKGKINSTEGKIPENTYLLLYKDKDDSAFLSKKPYYITKIEAEGNFLLENVKEGKYKIYALNDKNNNYFYDLPTELIAFDTTYYSIAANLDTLNLLLFLPEPEKLRVVELDRTIKGGQLNCTTNKEISFLKDEITATIVGNPMINPIVFQEKESKKIKIYFPKMENDTATFRILIKNNTTLIDSFNISTESKNFKKPVLFFTDTANIKNLKIIETKPLQLISAFYSLSQIDTTKIELKDSTLNKIPFIILKDEDLQTYFIKANWKGGMNYKLIFKDSVFSDLVGNWSKKQEFSILTTSIKKAGNLLITYELPKKNTNYIVFLKDIQGKVLDKRILRDSQRVKIDYGLQFAGTYSVEVVEDLNEDGIWNSGNFSKKTFPEKIYKYVKPILIKENWDAEEIVKVDFSLKSSETPNPLKKENAGDILEPDGNNKNLSNPNFNRKK